MGEGRGERVGERDRDGRGKGKVGQVEGEIARKLERVRDGEGQKGEVIILTGCHHPTGQSRLVPAKGVVVHNSACQIQLCVSHARTYARPPTHRHTHTHVHNV